MYEMYVITGFVVFTIAYCKMYVNILITFNGRLLKPRNCIITNHIYVINHLFIHLFSKPHRKHIVQIFNNVIEIKVLNNYIFSLYLSRNHQSEY